MQSIMKKQQQHDLANQSVLYNVNEERLLLLSIDKQ